MDLNAIGLVLIGALFVSCGATAPVEPVCGNGTCAGGESYENCPEDCTLQDIIGTPCGAGACEPGEDSDYCPDDCKAIQPTCGNDVCDSGETENTCYADCEGVSPGPDASCDSNSDCGYKQKCKGGECVTVECTSDSQCSGCKRCSDNTCVSCGSGPYGCYC